MHTGREGFLDCEYSQEHQEELSFPDGSIEPKDICVLVICREGFMREAIENSLRSAGLACVRGVGTICELKDLDYECHAFLCITPSDTDVPSDDELTYLDHLHDRNWIVMSHNRSCIIFNKLNELGANVSAVPFDISGRDLAHLARVAANDHRVLVDKFCEGSISVGSARLAAAELTTEQTQLLQQIANGDPNKIIAMREGWSEPKVKMQVRALLKKLDVANRTQAAVLAIRAGLYD